jgi:4-alpha-glucanotransferase
LHGVIPSYVDVARQRREASPEALIGVLQALGVDLRQPGDIDDAIRRAHLDHWQTILEPVAVAWDGKLNALPVRLPAAHGGLPVQWRLHLEDGRVLESPVHPWRQRAARKAARIGGEPFEERLLRMPSRLPLGYHRLELETDLGPAHCLIIAAPVKAWSDPQHARTWGAFAPLYALHSDAGWGSGDFGDLDRLSRWVGDRGGGVVSTLPLLAAFLDEPFEPSPYSPVSRLFWNEFYVRPEESPEWASCARARRRVAGRDFQQRIRAQRRASEVDYRSGMAARREVLEALAHDFFKGDSSRRADEFKRFLLEHPAVEDYARFRATVERRRASWHSWPARLRDGRLQPGDYAESARRYHLYAQWLAHEQMTRLSLHAGKAGVQLYLDMPLGVNADGFDVWRHRDQFALRASGGAPPDSVFTKGQDWGFPPLHPAAMRRQGYRYVIEFLRHHMRQAGVLRFDHVMSLRRLYWVPRGLSAREGAYVGYPLDELCAVLCLESRRHQTRIVGENLGTVPPEVNTALKRHHIREMYVVQYELQPNARRALRTPPQNCVASLNTHDMPPFAAMRRGLDIADRADLGLLSPSAVKREQRRCRALHRALDQFLASRGGLPAGRVNEQGIIESLLLHLASSPAETVLVNLEDLWQETLPQNVPGTSTERVNWRRKTRWPLEHILGSDAIRELIERLNRARGG